MRYNLDNPVKPIASISLEKEEFKVQSKINTLLHLNLKKIVKEKDNPKRLNIIVVNGRMYY